MDEADNTMQDCHICGTSLEYRAEGIPVRCTVCGREERGNVLCPEGHYVCEACHSPDFSTDLRTFLRESSETSPFVLAEELMDHHGLPMLGCEHAHIAAGALMTALRNSGQAGVDDGRVEEALARTARQAVSAYCGLSGVCGVVPALGACYSVLVGARCGLGPQTKATMELTGRLGLVAAEHAEPGCCKAYVRACLATTTEYMEETLDINLPGPISARCLHHARHPHGCRGPACPWYPDTATLQQPAGPADAASAGKATPAGGSTSALREEEDGG